MSLEDDHHHCRVCGKVCEPDSEFCSKNCRLKRERQLQSRRNLTYMIYGTIALLALFFLLSVVHV